MWVVMVQHKTSDQYLTSGEVSTRSIHRFKKYRLLKTLTKNFNILSNADANMDTNADADVTAIAVPVFTYRRVKNGIYKTYELQCPRAIIRINTVFPLYTSITIPFSMPQDNRCCHEWWDLEELSSQYGTVSETCQERPYCLVSPTKMFWRH